MTTGSILLGLALILLVGLFIAQPLLLPEEKKARSRSPRQKLLAQKAALLEEVRALDFDYDTGKIPQEVYEPQRAQLVAAAAEVLQSLEGLSATAVPNESLPPTAVADQPTPAEVDPIEMAVSRRRQPVADDIETAVSRMRSQAKPSAQTAVPANGKNRFCPQCGHTVAAGDKFCVSCGQNLTVKTA